MEQVDFLIIGGGVVGLAVCAEITSRFEDSSVILLEKHPKFGQETSSRNSEVIHSGIYYPAGSLKAKLCVKGKELLYEFCRDKNVPFERIGKLIVAQNDEETKTLDALIKKGRDNGVDDLEMLDEDRIKTMEPGIKALAAVFSPSTGIIDSHQLMARLEAISKQGYAFLAYGHEVIGIERSTGGYIITYRSNDGSMDMIECRWLINCAGLNSDKIAAMAGMDIEKEKYTLYPCKGEYFSITNSKSGFVKRLVYPPPLAELQGLGIHVTKSLDGRIRLGPNAFYIDTPDYDINIDHAGEFFEAAKQYLPFLHMEDIEPDTVGIRPKLQGPGDNFRDFVIRHEALKGFPGLINLIGIESPGLTACLGIATMVSDIIKEAEA